MVQFDPSEITGLENPNDITTIKKLIVGLLVTKDNTLLNTAF